MNELQRPEAGAAAFEVDSRPRDRHMLLSGRRLALAGVHVTMDLYYSLEYGFRSKEYFVLLVRTSPTGLINSVRYLFTDTTFFFLRETRPLLMLAIGPSRHGPSTKSAVHAWHGPSTIHPDSISCQAGPRA